MQNIRDEIWLGLLNPSPFTKHIPAMLQQCDEWCPDSEDFPSLYGTIGRHAVDAVYCALMCCLNDEVENSVFASRAAIESIDIYLHVVSDPVLGVHSHTADFDNWVFNSPLMLAEIKKQTDDIGLLTSHPNLDADVLIELRRSATDTGIQPFERGIIRPNYVRKAM